MCPPLQKAVISATGHLKEFTHANNWISRCIYLYHLIFVRRPHFLWVVCIKSLSNSFSIRSCMTSFCNAERVQGICLAGRPRRFGIHVSCLNADSVVGICLAGLPRRFGIRFCSFLALRLGLLKHSLTCSFVNPNICAICRQLYPS
mgnify:CR=1 FL=1